MLKLLSRFLIGNWLLAVGLAVLAQGIATQARQAPSRPFVLIDEQELANLRRDLAQSGWKWDLYRTPRNFSVMNSGCGVRANADLWLERAIEIPARGGHYHHFFCAEGDRLELPKDQRFAPGPYRCPQCRRAYSGERFEGALRRIAHGWLAQAALDLALVSAIEHKPEYAVKAAEILLKYAAAYPGPHTSNTAGGMIYQSLDESMWIIPLAQAYDLVYQTLSPDDRERIGAFLRTAAQGIQKCGTGGNWGSWHLSAVGVVGYAIEDAALVAWATERFKQQITGQLGDDGLWPESVHTYHFFPLLAFMHLAEAAWHAGTDLYHWETKPGKSLLSMFSAPLAFAYPDLRLPAINDGWFDAFLPTDTYELAWHRTQDPRFAWVLANGYRRGITPAGLVASSSRDNRRDGLYAFLFGRRIPRQTTPPPAVSTNFPILGIAVLRSPNGAMLTFDYGPMLGHGQPDKMGITLFAKDKLWFADYGTPGYGSAILPWYVSTFAHNTIVVDGRSQAPTKENGAQLWLGGEDLEAVQAQTREAYPGVTHTRTIIRIDEYFVLWDLLESPSEHTYDFFLHSEGELSLDGPKQTGLPAEAPVRWIKNLTAFAPASGLSGRWSEGKKGVAFWLGTPTGAKIPAGVGQEAAGPSQTAPAPIIAMIGKCPAETGSRQIPLLVARQRGQTAQFITVLWPYSRKPKFSVTAKDHEVWITHGRSRDQLTLRRPAECPSVLRSQW